MDLYHLATFCHVARVLNFSRAAEKLSLSQSAVSRHIEALEQEFGMELFTRSGRGVALTEAGIRLHDYAERILSIAGETTRTIAELKNLESGRLWVGASTTPGNYLLGPVIATYQQRYPGVDVRLDIADSQAVLRSVEAGAVDAAVVAISADGTGVDIEPCIQDELLLVMAPHHPLVRRADIQLPDLQGVRLFLRESGSHTRQAAEDHFRIRGFTPGPVCELGSTEAIKRAVAAGGGVAFLSRYAVAPEIRSGMLAAVGGEDCHITRQFGLAFPKGRRRPPAVLAFAALLRKMRSELEERDRGI